jgi:hypothetical protein
MKKHILTDDLEREICRHIAEGWTLKQIAALPDFPPVHAIVRWATDERRFPRFVDRYRHARRASAEVLVEKAREAVESATDRDSAQAARVKFEGYKWLASRFHPERYAERWQVGTNLGVEHQTSFAEAAPAWLQEAIGAAGKGVRKASQKGHLSQGSVIQNDEMRRLPANE